MEFGRRSGDEMVPPAFPFEPQPPHFDPRYHPAVEREFHGDPSRAMRRELMKERIRAEIIARNSEEWRVLEEEVMREMEMERAMGVQRVVPPIPPAPGLFEKRRVEFGEGRDSGVLVNPPVKRARIEPSLGCDGRGVEMMEPSPAAAAAAAAAEASLFKCGTPGKKMKGPAVTLGEESWRCDLCNVTTTCEENLNDHKNGKRHKAMLRNKEALPGEQSWNCAVCQVSLTSQDNLNDHLQGKKHHTLVQIQASWTSNIHTTSSMPTKEE